MSAADVMFGVLMAVVGIVAAILVTRHYYLRGGGARLKISVGISESAHIDPGTVGTDLALRIGTYDVRNLIVFDLTVRNEGADDVVVTDAEDATQQHLRPRIELPPGFRALVDPWTPGGASAAADVRVARTFVDDCQRLHLHIHRLGVREQVHVTVVCTFRPRPTVSPVRGREIGFYRGFLGGVDVEAVGLLSKSRFLRE